MNILICSACITPKNPTRMLNVDPRGGFILKECGGSVILGLWSWLWWQQRCEGSSSTFRCEEGTSVDHPCCNFLSRVFIWRKIHEFMDSWNKLLVSGTEPLMDEFKWSQLILRLKHESFARLHVFHLDLCAHGESADIKINSWHK